MGKVGQPPSGSTRVSHGRTTERLDIVLAESHEIVRAGLGDMLLSTPGVGSLRSVNSGEEMLRAVARGRPDILIVSTDVPEEAIRAASRDMGAGLNILVIIRGEDAASLTAASLLPANGYLLQSELNRESLTTAISRVAAGEKSIPPRLIDHLLYRVNTRGRAKHSTLTPREKQVLMLLGEGLSNKQIARRLTISEPAVKRHVGKILIKLNVGNRTLAALRAREG